MTSTTTTDKMQMLDESFEKQCAIEPPPSMTTAAATTTTTTSERRSGIASAGVRSALAARNLEFFNQLSSKLNEIKTKLPAASAASVAKYADSLLVDSVKSITKSWGGVRGSQFMSREDKVRLKQQEFLAFCLAPEINAKLGHHHQHKTSSVKSSPQPMEMETVVVEAVDEQSAALSSRHVELVAAKAATVASARSSMDHYSSAAAATASSSENAGKSLSSSLTKTAANGRRRTEEGPTPAKRPRPSPPPDDSTRPSEPTRTTSTSSSSSSSTASAAAKNGGSGGGANGERSSNGDHAAGANNGDKKNNDDDDDDDEKDPDDKDEDDDDDEEAYKRENRGLYCVCERSHEFLLDEQTRMCDSCQSWYHVACILPYLPASQQAALGPKPPGRSAAANDDDAELLICPVCLKNAEFGRRYEALINYRVERLLGLKLSSIHSVQKNDFEFDDWDVGYDSAEEESDRSPEAATTTTVAAETRRSKPTKKKKISLDDFLVADSDASSSSSSSSSSDEEKTGRAAVRKPAAPKPKLGDLTEAERQRKLDQLKAKHAGQPKSIKTLDGYRDSTKPSPGKKRPLTAATMSVRSAGPSTSTLSSLKDRIKAITPVKEQQKLANAATAAAASKSAPAPVEYSARTCLACSKQLRKYVIVEAKTDGARVQRLNQSQYCNNACVGAYVNALTLDKAQRVYLVDKQTGNRSSLTRRDGESLDDFRQRVRSAVCANKRQVAELSLPVKPVATALVSQSSVPGASAQPPGGLFKLGRSTSVTAPTNLQEIRANGRAKLFECMREKLTLMEKSGGGAAAGDWAKVEDGELTKLVETIEAELFKALELSAYRKKLLINIISNIKDHANRTFVRKLVTGEIRPEQLATMDSSGMKSDESLESEKRERELEVMRRLNSERERQELALRMIRTKKTRQGEIEVCQDFMPELIGFNAADAGVATRPTAPVAPDSGAGDDGGEMAAFGAFEITMDEDGPLGTVISMPAEPPGLSKSGGGGVLVLGLDKPLPLPKPIAAAVAAVKAVVPSLDAEPSRTSEPARSSSAAVLTTHKTSAPPLMTHDPDFDSDPEDGAGVVKPPSDPRRPPKPAAPVAVPLTKPMVPAVLPTLPVPPPLPVLSSPPVVAAAATVTEKPAVPAQPVDFNSMDFQFDLSLKNIPPESPTKMSGRAAAAEPVRAVRSLDLTRQSSEPDDLRKPFWTGLLKLKESNCGVRGFILPKADRPDCPLTEKLRRHRFPPILTHTGTMKVHDIWNYIFLLNKRKELAFFRLESNGKEDGSTDFNEEQGYVTMPDDVMYPIMYGRIGALALPRFSLPAIYTDKEKPCPAESLILVALKQKPANEEEDTVLRRNLGISLRRDKNHIVGILVGPDKPTPAAAKNGSPVSVGASDAAAAPPPPPPGNGEQRRKSDTPGDEAGAGEPDQPNQAPSEPVGKVSAAAPGSSRDPRLERMNAGASKQPSVAKDEPAVKVKISRRVSRFSDTPAPVPTPEPAPAPATHSKSYELVMVLFKYFEKNASDHEARQNALTLFATSLESDPLNAEERARLNAAYKDKFEDFLILVNSGDSAPEPVATPAESEDKLQSVVRENAMLYLKQVQQSIKETEKSSSAAEPMDVDAWYEEELRGPTVAATAPPTEADKAASDLVAVSDDSFQSAVSSPRNEPPPKTSPPPVPQQQTSDARDSFRKLLELQPESRASLSLRNANWSFDPAQELRAKVAQHGEFCRKQENRPPPPTTTTVLPPVSSSEPSSKSESSVAAGSIVDCDFWDDEEVGARPDLAKHPAASTSYVPSFATSSSSAARPRFQPVLSEPQEPDEASKSAASGPTEQARSGVSFSLSRDSKQTLSRLVRPFNQNKK